MKRAGALIIMVLLSGCIPRSPLYPGKATPHLETEMDMVFDERPVWEDRPVIADQVAAEKDVHIVKPGDTGIAIARAYAVPWSRIVEANGLTEPFIIKVGQRIRIPGAEAPTAQTMEARAAAFRLDIDDILTGGEPAQEAVMSGTILPPRGPTTEPSRFSGAFGWPARGSILARFGPAGEGQVNEGIDIATAPSTPIRATADGVVAFVGNNVAGFGGMILVRHGGGWISAYGRAASTNVARGQKVKRGDVIGATGIGAAPQVHFELRQNRKPVDPLSKLPAL
jgi:lipoprotein NlpD